MNVTTKTEKTYNLLDMTETQAEDLLKLAMAKPEHVVLDIRDDSIAETLSSVRQALLSVGVKLPTYPVGGEPDAS